jgi:AcrR family transcriptional regulator
MQRGYTAVSITDIIRAAKVTKPTLYYYFADKEALFLHTGLRVLAVMGDEMDSTMAAASGDFRQRLLTLAESMMHDSDRDVRMMRHEMWEHLGPAARERLAHAFFRRLFAPIIDLMEQGLQSGALAGYPAHVLATMFMGMAESFQEFGAQSRLSGWAEENQPPIPVSSTPLTTAHLVDMFLHGAAGPQASRRAAANN